MLSIKIDGIKELQDKIRAAQRFAESRKFKSALMEAARPLFEDMRRRAPYNPKRKRGIHLREAIFLGPGDPDYPDVLVGVNQRKAPHARLLEYGTRRMAPRPYFRPAVEANRFSTIARISEAIDKLLSEAMR